jgi:hypothetical protein
MKAKQAISKGIEFEGLRMSGRMHNRFSQIYSVLENRAIRILTKYNGVDL